MTAPVNRWQHLLSTLMSIHNKLVKREFADLETPGVEWLEDFNTPRSSLRTACTLQATDSAVVTMIRLFFFYVICRRARDLHPPIYGIPSQDLYEQFDSKGLNYPQIILHFSETRYDAANNDRMPATAQISVRYRDNNITTTELNTLATKIKTIFATPPFKWKKGRILYTYVDRSKGYFFQLYADSELEAKSVINKVWDIQDTDTPDFTNKLKKHTDDINYTTIETIFILGETKKKPKRRPITNVEFTHAEFILPGLLDAIILVDLTGTHAGALVYV